MAILTTLFSALARKLGDLLQAVFGWSISALFGKLSSQKQILISVALVMSLFWPIFVVGAFVPKTAAFVIAFVPVKDLGTSQVMRVIWIAMAVLAPVIVGILTRVVSPDARRNSFFVSVLNGYPLALGFALSFIITLVTVPLVKIATLFRRWDEQHIYVQPKKDRYLDALRNLCEACVMAGIEPRASKVPTRMALSTKVIQFFARGAVDSLVVANPLRIRAKGIELYLYPADLLIRGEKTLVAKVRAMLNRTLLERDAYLVADEKAQDIQDELGRLWEVLDRHESVDQIGSSIKTRLKEIVVETTQAELPFEEWVLLDRVARRVENKLLNVHSIVEETGVKKTHEEAQAVTAGTASMPSNAVTSRSSPLDTKAVKPLNAPSTVELVETAFREARELIAIEVALAKEELSKEVKATATAGIGFAIAAGCVVSMFALLGVALVLALGGTAGVAAIVAGGFLVVGVIAAGVGYSLLPKKPMARTRKHLVNDINQLREHVA